MPEQLSELDQEQLSDMGLELGIEQLWNPDGDEKTGGLMRAAVNLSGCSAAFISDEGLIATNHHCAYSTLQENSSTEHDYIKEGFLARERSEELPGKSARVRVLRRIEDVSTVMEEAAEGQDDAARAKAVDRKRKELVAACEAAGENLSCSVASFYRGASWRLFEYIEIDDIRVVYAPPSAVGEYGGEVDNWMWPRHTGDFSLLRAYVDGKPYKPGQYLKVSAQGVAPDDFVAILGYPGRTQRYMSAAEVARQREQALPFRVEFYGEWIEILESLGEQDEAVKIKVASLKKRLANVHKNSRGMIDGLDHMQLTKKREEENKTLLAWAAKQEDPRYTKSLEALEERAAASRESYERDVLLGAVTLGPNGLGLAVHLARRATERSKPDLERAGTYMDRASDRLWKGMERRLRDFDAGVDTALLSSIVTRSVALGDKGSPALQALADGETEPKAIEAKIKALVEGSKLADLEANGEFAKRLWDATEAGGDAPLRATKDPLILAGVAVAKEIAASEEAGLREEGEMLRVGPTFFEILRANREGPIYPDANSTIRFSYAQVKGYDKWDGQHQTPQTVLAGAVAKHTGEEPFDLPEPVRAKADGAPKTYWADPELEDVPLCFLSNGDTTGGNSGSPVINGKGEFVGLNFDRVWENIAGDFGYNTGHSRNITVDVRYLLWTLDQVEDAGHLLKEMGVAQHRNQPARGATDKADTDSQAKPAANESKPAGCACSLDGRPAPLGAGLFVLVLAGIRPNRRRT